MSSMYGSTSQAEKAPNKSFQRTAKSAAEFNRYAILLSGGKDTVEGVDVRSPNLLFCKFELHKIRRPVERNRAVDLPATHNIRTAMLDFAE